jgi:hypothetical protein
MRSNFIRVAKTVLKTALPATVLVGSLAGCGTYTNTNASSFACAWDGGTFDAKTFAEYAAPGAGRKNVGWGSTVQDIPVGVRSFRIAQDPAAGDTPVADALGGINGMNVGGIQMKQEATMTFTINSAVEDVNGKKKPVGCTLFETQLKQFAATDFNSTDDKSGWLKFLNERVRPSIDLVAGTVLARLDPLAVYNNTEITVNISGVATTGPAREVAAKAMSVEFTKANSQLLGSKFWCSSAYKFAGDAAACGNPEFILPQPHLSAEDAKALAAPLAARVAADAEIAKQKELTRQSAQTANELENQAKDAKRLADAKAAIANAQTELTKVQAENDATVQRCKALAAVGADCALVMAAEHNQFPTIYTSNAGSGQAAPPPVVISVTPSTSSTTVAAKK